MTAGDIHNLVTCQQILVFITKLLCRLPLIVLPESRTTFLWVLWVSRLYGVLFKHRLYFHRIKKKKEEEEIFMYFNFKQNELQTKYERMIAFRLHLATISCPYDQNLDCLCVADDFPLNCFRICDHPITVEEEEISCILISNLHRRRTTYSHNSMNGW